MVLEQAKVSQMPGVGRDIDFQSVLQGPHMQQAQRYHRECSFNQAQDSLECFEGKESHYLKDAAIC